MLGEGRASGLAWLDSGQVRLGVDCVELEPCIMAFDCPKSSVESLIDAVLDPDVGIRDHVVRVGMVLPRVGRYLPLDSGLIEARYVVRSLDPRRELFLEVPLRVESGMLIASVSFQDVLEIVNDSGVVLGLLHEVHALHFFHICLLLNCFVQCCVDECCFDFGPVHVRHCLFV